MWRFDLRFGKRYEEMDVAIAGERHAAVVAVDVGPVRDRWPDAAFSVRIRRGDGAEYLAAAGLMPDAAGRVAYLLTPTDASAPGPLSMEWDAVAGDVRVISCMFPFKVLEGLAEGAPLPPPPPEATWVDDVKRAAAEAAGSRAVAEMAADRAAQIADTVEGIRGMDAEARSLPVGSAATAAVREAEGRYTLLLGIPQGEAGPQGPPGPKGDMGPQGAQGAPGLQGPQGLPGAAGPRGEPGMAGERGPQGLTGVPGPKGDPGDPGGPKGDPGAVFTPSIAADGTVSWTNNGGLTNPSAVNVRGAKGDPGVQGVKGDQGPKGNTGATGPKGDPGPQGLQGVQGPKGDKGDKGDTGATGATGTAGATGAPGAQGNPGAHFTPSVNATGLLSWTNNGGLQNPPAVNIRGPQGEPGSGGAGSGILLYQGTVNVTVSSPVPNTYSVDLPFFAVHVGAVYEITVNGSVHTFTGRQLSAGIAIAGDTPETWPGVGWCIGTQIVTGYIASWFSSKTTRTGVTLRIVEKLV